MVRSRRTVGFTLIELLVVIGILGILAGFVIPKLTDASEVSKLTNLTTQLQSIRNQLELAKLQHQDTYPNLSTWTALTTRTEPVAAYTPGDGADDAGPYLLQAPINPFEVSSTTAASPAAGVGWTYNRSTGSVKAVLSSAKAAALNVGGQTNDFATY